MEKRFRAISTVQYVIITVVAILMAVGVAAWLWTQQQAAMQQAGAVEVFGGLAYMYPDTNNNQIVAFVCLYNKGGTSVTVETLITSLGSAQSGATLNPGQRLAVEFTISGVTNIPTLGTQIQGTVVLSNGQQIPVVFTMVDQQTYNNYKGSC